MKKGAWDKNKKENKPKPPSRLDEEDTVDDAEFDLDSQNVLDALKKIKSVPKKIVVLETVVGYLQMEQNRNKLR